jgi:hypothetical protein
MMNKLIRYLVVLAALIGFTPLRGFSATDEKIARETLNSFTPIAGDFGGQTHLSYGQLGHKFVFGDGSSYLSTGIHIYDQFLFRNDLARWPVSNGQVEYAGVLNPCIEIGRRFQKTPEAAIGLYASTGQIADPPYYDLGLALRFGFATAKVGIFRSRMVITDRYPDYPGNSYNRYAATTYFSLGIAPSIRF